MLEPVLLAQGLAAGADRCIAASSCYCVCVLVQRSVLVHCILSSGSCVSSSSSSSSVTVQHTALVVHTAQRSVCSGYAVL
jgi:hypothetical protein